MYNLTYTIYTVPSVTFSSWNKVDFRFYDGHGELNSDSRSLHDDVIKWEHFPRYWPFVLEIHRSPVNSPHKGQWRGALMFSLICVWTNDWVNNRGTGNLRRYRVHYDVIVMHFYLVSYARLLRSTGRGSLSLTWLNTLWPRQNGRHFADDIFKRIFLNENIWIPIKIWLKFVSNGSINNIPALVQIMAWRRPGDKPLSEPMMVNSPTHICVTRPQWVNFNPSLGLDK